MKKLRQCFPTLMGPNATLTSCAPTKSRNKVSLLLACRPDWNKWRYTQDANYFRFGYHSSLSDCDARHSRVPYACTCYSNNKKEEQDERRNIKTQCDFANRQERISDLLDCIHSHIPVSPFVAQDEQQPSVHVHDEWWPYKVCAIINDNGMTTFLMLLLLLQ